MRKLLALLLLFTCAPVFAGAGLTQCVIATSAPGSITISTGGDTLLILLTGTGASGATLTGISDSQSQTITNDVPYSQMHDVTNSEYYPIGAWEIASANSGAHTISLTGTISTPQFVLCEASGISGLDVAQASTTSYGNSSSALSGSLTPSQTGDLLISWFKVLGAVTFSSYTNGFTQQASTGSTLAAASLIDSGSASISSGVTLSASNKWASYLIAYKAAAPAVKTGFVISNGHALISNGKPMVVN